MLSSSIPKNVSVFNWFCALSHERSRFKNMKGKSVKKSKDWIMEKKERRRRQGKYVSAFVILNNFTVSAVCDMNTSLL